MSGYSIALSSAEVLNVWLDLTPSQKKIVMSTPLSDGVLLGGRGSGNSFLALERKGIVHDARSAAKRFRSLMLGTSLSRWKLTKLGEILRACGKRVERERQRDRKFIMYGQR